MIRLSGLVDLQPPKIIAEERPLGDTTPSPTAGIDDVSGREPKSDMFAIHEQSGELYNMMNENEPLEGWALEKITAAADFIAAVYNHMKYEKAAPQAIGDGDGAPAEPTVATPRKPEFATEITTQSWAEFLEEVAKRRPTFLAEWLEKQGYGPTSK